MSDKKESLDEKLERINKEYTVAMREGRHSDAEALVRKSRRLKGLMDDDSDSDEEEVDAAVDDFEVFDGVGPELAAELRDRFTDIEGLAEASFEELVAVPGIGKKRAKQIHDEVNG